MSNSRWLATRGRAGFDDATATGLAALFAAVVGISVWSAAIARVARVPAGAAPRPWPLVVSTGAVSLLGLAGGALAYARYRGLTIPTGLPREGSWPAAGAGVVGPAVLVAATTVAGNAAGTPLSSLLSRAVSPDAPVTLLVWSTGLPSTLLGVGIGVLFGVVVPERVRALVGSGDAPVVATLLVGAFRLLPLDPAGPQFTAGGAVEFGATLVFGVALAASVGVLCGRVGTDAGGVSLDTDTLGVAHLLVFVLSAVGLVGAATGLTTLGELVDTGLWVAALGLAIVGYERTRSAWVPVLGLVGFALALDVAVYLEARAGVGGL